MSESPEFTLVEAIQIGIWLHDVGEHVIVPLGRPPTVRDLHLTKFKAEIVDGQLVAIGPTVYGSAEAAWEIRRSLYEYAKSVGGGYEFGLRARYVVDLPHRRSFCPDVSWYTGDRRPARVCLGRRCSPWKYVIQRSMVTRRSGGWRRSAPTTSRRGRRWCGTWM